MLQELRAAFCILGLFLALTGVGYPFLMTGLGHSLFPYQAGGSLIVTQGEVRGSELIGQDFADPGFFHPRPSAAGSGYDAANSAGSNLAPTSRDLAKTITQRVADLRASDEVGPVPVDLVTASGSGLDPDISVAGVEFQAARVAQARGVALPEIQALIARTTTSRQWGFLGESFVNVVDLNRALDELAAPTPAPASAPAP